MRRLAVLLLPLTLAIPRASADDPAPKRDVVVAEGVVVDAESGDPIADAGVVVDPRGMVEGRGSLRAGGPLATTRAGADGRFRVEFAAPSDLVTVTAAAPGHASEERTLTPDESRAGAPLRFALARAGRLTGRVVGPPPGAPIAGAKVYALSASAPAYLRDAPDGVYLGRGADGVTRSWTALVARTGPDGTYAIDGVRLGEPHVVMATKPGFGPTAWSNPSAPDRARPAAVVDLRLFASASVVVTVRDPEGGVVAGAWVYLGTRFADRGKTDASGVRRFTDVPPGRHRVAASATGRLDATAEVEVAEGAADVPSAIVLSRGLVLEGVLLDDRAEPVQHARVSVERPTGTAEFRALSPSSASGVTDARGRFRLPALSEGVHELKVAADGHERLEQRVSLPAAELRLVAGRHAAAVGRLVAPTGSSMPAELEATYDTLDRKAFGWPDVALEGSALSVRALAGGRIHLVLYPKAFAPIVRELVAPPGGEAKLGDLPLDAGFPARGRVVDRRGVAIAGAKVSTWRSDASAPQETTTQGDGTYEFEHLAEGTLALDVEAEGRLDASAEASVKRDAPLPTIVVTSGGLLHGRVVNADGTPLDGHVGLHVFDPKPADDLDRDAALYTKDDGTFEVRVPAGRYVVEVRDALDERVVLATAKDVVVDDEREATVRVPLGSK